MEKYYTRISISRLSTLLDLSPEVCVCGGGSIKDARGTYKSSTPPPPKATEKNISNLVDKKTIFAKIDRPAGVVTFRKRQDPNEVLNDWGHNVSGLMTLLDKATHLIHKEVMQHKQR